MKRWMVIALLCVLGFGFGVFFMPLPLYGVCNIGSITGMLLCGGLFLCVLFRKRVTALLQKCRKTKAGTALLCVLAAGALCAAAAGAVLSVQIVRAAKNAPPEEASLTVVVLGCRVYDSGPCLMLWSRINTAYEYLAAHPEAVCILSGGQGDDEPMSEAQAMFDALTAKGVDPARLMMEDQSRSTVENLAFSMEIIKEKGLPESIALVTNEYHQYRASLLAAAAGYGDTYALSAPSQKILIATYFVRELFGVVYALLGGSGTIRITHTPM